MNEVFHLQACAYCHRVGQPLEGCCDRPEHSGNLVCADVRDCLGVVLTLLHESEQRLAEPAPVVRPEPGGRRLCSHADEDGRGMHWLRPGEVCPLAAGAPGGAERQARVTAASAVLADYLRWTTGETVCVDGAGDWRSWADRLATHLGWVLGALPR